MHIIKTVALSLAIIVVFNLFIGMGIRTFYSGPAQEHIQCGGDNIKVQEEKASCEEIGGVWNEVPETEKRLSPTPAPSGFCDLSACFQKAQEEREPYRRNVFVIWVVAGIAALLIGMHITAAPGVSAGLSFGAIVSFIIGTAGYWADMDEYIRFIIVTVVLAILIWLGYRRSRKGNI